MKLQIILVLITCGFLACKNTQMDYTIENLPKPEIKGGKPLMLALRDRRTTREFSEKEFSPQQISNLLWAAGGINRPETGGRTFPSACNKQEIDIYVALKTGVYIFDFKDNQLKSVLKEDLRSFIGQQDFVKTAPICFLFVANMDKACGDDSSKIVYSAADAAYISQNVYLYCASENLATVVLGMVNRELLSEKLSLRKEQKIILAQPVAFKK